MSTLIEKVLVVGIGKVGSLVGTILHENGFSVTGLDAATRDNLTYPVDYVLSRSSWYERPIVKLNPSGPCFVLSKTAQWTPCLWRSRSFIRSARTSSTW